MVQDRYKRFNQKYGIPKWVRRIFTFCKVIVGARHILKRADVRSKKILKIF